LVGKASSPSSGGWNGSNPAVTASASDAPRVTPIHPSPPSSSSFPSWRQTLLPRKAPTLVVPGGRFRETCEECVIACEVLL
jgi:hypothetical protein